MGNWFSKTVRWLESKATAMAAGPYRAGEITRLNKSWLPQHYSGDGAVKEAWDLATRRVRDLGRNDPAVIALRRTMVDHTISTGIGASGDVVIDGQWEEEYNEEADALFEEWAEGECDYEGRLSLADMERQFFAEMLETGTGLALKCLSDDPSRLIPLCYQVLESEQLDTAKDQAAGRNQNEIRQGIEYDAAGRRVAYWLFDCHPNDPYRTSWESRRILAERILDISLPGRPSQSRSMSLYTGIVQSAKDLDNYLGTELTSATIASLLSIVHETSRPGNGLGFAGDGTDTETSDEYGNPKVKLGRGIVCQVPKGDKVTPVSVNRPNSNARTFVDLILMLIGMGGGVSRYRLTRDYSGTTYIAARAAQLDDRSAFRPLQAFFGRQFLRPIWRECVSQMVAYGQLRSVPVTQFERQRRRWLRYELQFPGWEQLDTEAETDSALKRIAGGLSTRQIEAAKLGVRWRRIDRQRARELAHEKKTIGVEGGAYSYDLPSTPKRNDRQEPAGQPGGGDQSQDQGN